MKSHLKMNINVQESFDHFAKWHKVTETCHRCTFNPAVMPAKAGVTFRPFNVCDLVMKFCFKPVLRLDS